MCVCLFLQKLQPLVNESVPFPCDVTNGRSPKRPKSVHELRPGDIDVIGSMGDSLTAGNGIFATNLLEVFMENRGATAYIGTTASIIIIILIIVIFFCFFFRGAR